MNSLLILFLITLFTTISGYLINQVLALGEFPGRNVYIFRLLGCLVALGTILTALSNEDLSEKFSWLKTGALLIGTFIVFDAAQMGWAIWKHKQSTGVTIDDAHWRTELLKASAKDIHRRQLENLKNLEPRVVIPIEMRDEPEQVGKPKFVPPQANETTTSNPLAGIVMPVKRWLKRGNRPKEEISVGRRLIDVFYQVDQRLLILGKPGSGKTTLLLELADQLLNQAQEPGRTHIPVLLECSAWKNDQQPLKDWLVEQLKTKYNVPFSVSQRLLAGPQFQLLPLLDGLDELGLVRQVKAIQAIDQFIQQNNYPALVVCCRQEEFEQGQVKPLSLQGAVYLEPLKDEQIRTYLCDNIRRPQLWKAIQSTELRNLLPNWEASEQEPNLPGLRSPLLLNMLLVSYQGGLVQTQSDLFEVYIQEQFRQHRAKHSSLPYSKAQTRHYLTWLARQLKADNTTEFEIENLQPNWLEKTWRRWLYRLIIGLIFGLIIGLISGLIRGLIFGLIFGLISGLILGLISGLDDIGTTEAFDFSPQGIQRGIKYALIVGPIVGLIFGLIFGLIGGLISDLIGGLILGLVLGLIFGLIVGLQNNNIRIRELPNQGVWDSLKNTVFIALIASPGGILLITLPRLATGQTVEWEKWLLFGLAGGLVFSTYSFQTLLKHGTLRVLLWLSKSSPWNYADFLAYASELRLLQNLGGRYRFVHDLLREHLVANQPLPRRYATSSFTPWVALIIALLVALPVGNGIIPVSTEMAEVTAPSLQAGDLGFYDQYSYRAFRPKRFELIGYFENDTSYVMWVVGLPGDRISSQGSKLLINGQRFDNQCTDIPEGYTVEPFQVPDQRYFVVGKVQDNDGIRPSGVVVQRSQITGRFTWRVWPLHRFGSIRCDRPLP